jgi:chromosomal replication initiator protein
MKDMLDLQCMVQDELDNLWQNCHKKIENAIDKITYETIVKYIRPTVVDTDTLELAVSNQWQKDGLGKHIDSLKEIISDEAGGFINLNVVVKPENEINNGSENVNAVNDNKPTPVSHVEVLQNGRDRTFDSGEIRIDGERSFNPRYVFDSFVVGNSNRFAHAAAQAVADAPAITYNPLFIYGGVGLGKTHLIQAIGHRVLMNNPEARVVYVSAEKFMNDMIESIQNKKMMEFRRKYRNVNVLLIDDIQFIKNKESTQEEFFHTFNELHSAKSQIVITSDRPPKDIPTLEDRLRSRFEWGVIADISTPDVETRMAILKKKAEMEKVDVPNEVILFIAEKVPSNIRELEGALNRVICYGSLMNHSITIDLTIQALKSIIPDTNSRNISVSKIQEAVCEYYNVRHDELIGKCRDSRYVVPRQVAMFLAKDIMGTSFPNIGKSFGGRDHTTVMHACKKIDKIKRETTMKNDLQNIKDLLKKTSG